MPTTPNTPQSTQQTKRKLLETSPEETNMNEKPVGNMEVGELMDLMKTTMNCLLEEKLSNLPTKQDIEELKTGMAMAASEISDLKAENRKLKEELEILKLKLREDENNMIWLEHNIAPYRNVVPYSLSVFQLISGRLSYPSMPALRSLFRKLLFPFPLSSTVEHEHMSTCIY